MEEESTSDALLRVGDTVAGRYTLTRLLGEGGMGAVYGAEHTVTRRRVAVKLLRSGGRWNKNSVDRFLREAQIAASIRHPGIIDVLDAGTDDSGAPFLVFELLEGSSVASLMKPDAPLPLPLALTIIHDTLDALAAAHEQKIFHRDIKPDNVFLAKDGRGQPVVKVLDFGISKAAADVGVQGHTTTRTGVLMGTPAYMSPEQVRGQSDVDGRSDVWSVGVMLYEMLVGRPPFQAGSLYSLMQMIDRDPVAPVTAVAPGTPPALAAIVERALAKDRDDRFPNAAAMREALDTVRVELGLGNETVALRPSSVPPPGFHVGAAPLEVAHAATVEDSPRLPAGRSEVVATLDPHEASTLRGSRATKWLRNPRYLAGLVAFVAIVAAGVELKARRESLSQGATPARAAAIAPDDRPATVIHVAATEPTVVSPTPAPSLPVVAGASLTPPTAVVPAPSNAELTSQGRTAHERRRRTPRRRTPSSPSLRPVSNINGL